MNCAPAGWIRFGGGVVRGCFWGSERGLCFCVPAGGKATGVRGNGKTGVCGEGDFGLRNERPGFVFVGSVGVCGFCGVVLCGIGSCNPRVWFWAEGEFKRQKAPVRFYLNGKVVAMRPWRLRFIYNKT